jgi:lysophospholipase L1-like esterase
MYMSDFLSIFVRRFGRSPSILSFLLFAGLISLGAILFFHALLAAFIAVPIFFAVLLAAYAAFNLLLYFTLPADQFRRLWQQALLMAAGLIAGLLILEAGLRLLNPNPAYLMLPPNARWEFHPSPDIIPGVDEYSLYTTNAAGIRGDAYRENGRYNILAIGGSTTEAALLDDTKTWTYLLQARLNQENGRPPNLDPEISVWVGNVGRSGHGLVEHIHALQFFAPQYKIDAVIVLAGINDFTAIIQQPELYHARYENPGNYAFYLHRSFYTRPLVDGRMARPFPENTAVWNLVDVAVWNLLGRLPQEIVVEMPDAGAYTGRRENYLAAPLLPRLPDLEPALAQYRANLRRLASLAEAQHIRLIFATQPAVWHEGLSPEMERLLWFGFRGDIELPDGRYSPVDLLAGLNQFNDALLDFCREQPLECIDLAAEMNGQETYFYDDVHFNKAGSAKVAKLLAAYLQQNK